ncbi:hypothetical protein [Marinoscillum furvescens]|uniref:Lipocalin-like protein n=1 Tax=Marinoscillum furvescens DSM 4134 TaxID=1122208 RepID=A0A3D9KZB8_MARFU|nr:hypothetical protein [Marinoscillum furvescens]RED94380.1 hypothetical protein C7460_12167 [Marinoscillum furvescens DSM 4134]
MTLKYRLIFPVLILMLCQACQDLTPAQISGLWRLDALNIDGFEKPVDQLYMQLQPNGSFAVTRPAGDLVGTYELHNGEIHFNSPHTPWWNDAWSLQLIQRQLRLRGKKAPYFTTFLTFTPVEKIPDFDEFEEELVGNWVLYRIRKKGKKTFPAQTYMSFTPVSYLLSVDGKTQERGGLKVDPRHRKLIFENQETAWKAWFYGRELRLSNAELELEYSLRRQ